MGEQIRVIATKPFRYGTRRLLPGEDFLCGPRDARLLQAVGKVKPAPVAPVPAIPAAVKALAETTAPPKPAEPADDIKALREQYTATVGRNPFMGWDANELRRRMAAHEAGTAAS